jgi:uncharacterized membrane protein
MTDTVTAAAIAAIGANPDGNISVGKVEKHIEALTAGAGALKRVLSAEASKIVATQQATLSREADEHQGVFKRNRNIVIAILVLALVVSVAALTVPVPEQHGQLIASIRLATVLLVYFALVVPLVIGLLEQRSDPRQRWNEARGDSEHLRRRRFEVVIEGKTEPLLGEIPLLPLKLEYFRRYQVEVQREHYKEKFKENADQAALAKWLIIPCMLVVFGWLALMLLAFAAVAGEQGMPPAWLPDGVIGFAADLHLIERFNLDIIGLLLAIALAALYGAAYLRSLLFTHQRNASRFERAFENMSYLMEKPLEDARAAARSGDEAGVRAFVARVHSVMSTEYADWIRLRKLDEGLRDTGHA